jgi:hypothetical protein
MTAGHYLPSFLRPAGHTVDARNSMNDWFHKTASQNQETDHASERETAGGH